MWFEITYFKNLSPCLYTFKKKRKKKEKKRKKKNLNP